MNESGKDWNNPHSGCLSFRSNISFAAIAWLCRDARDVAQVALMESIAVAKTLADRNNYSISANKELIGTAMSLSRSLQG